MTGVRLYLQRVIPNYSMIFAGQFNGLVWCQSANNGSDIGVWYYPDGTQVPLFTGSINDQSAPTPTPLFSKRFYGQIALVRISELSGVEGLYTCIITDENGMNQTLVVGVYTDTTYNNNSK